MHENENFKKRSTLDSILSDGQVLAKTAESLRGRLEWFATFAFGRTANSCLRRLGEISMRSGRSHRLTGNDYAILTFLKSRVLTAPSIQINPCQLETWFIFTDGSCESQEASGGVGGVLMDPTGNVVHHVSRTVPKAIMDLLLEQSENPIYELELARILIATSLWGSLFMNSQVVMYLDNDAARAGLIKMRGATDIGDCIIQDVAVLRRNWHSDLGSVEWLLRHGWAKSFGLQSFSLLIGETLQASGVKQSAFFKSGSCGRLDDLTPLHLEKEIFIK